MEQRSIPGSSWTIDLGKLSLGPIIALAIVLRLSRVGGVDVFEDGYTNWMISSNLASTRTYEDRLMGMTGGNWLPLYHYIGAFLMYITGTDSILVLKVLSVLFSVGTVLFTYAIGERFGPGVGIAAALFMALNPLDILMSSMSIPDNLALFCLTASLYFIIFKRNSVPYSIIGSVMLLAAVMTRYEAWFILPIIAIHILKKDSMDRRALISSGAIFVAPLLFMLIWMMITFDGTFFFQKVFDQTALQPRIMEEVTGLNRGETVVVFWYRYLSNFTMIALLAVSLLFWPTTYRKKLPEGSFLLLMVWCALWTVISLLIALGMMVGSYRYLALTTVITSLFAAYHLKISTRWLTDRLNRGRKKGFDPEGRLSFILSILVVFLIMIPTMDHAFSREDSVSVLNGPQKRAGLWLKDHYEGGTVVVDSPITAYYSGIDTSKLIGSRELPDNIDDAMVYLLQNVSFFVFLDHPHFRAFDLFPSLRNGTSIGMFRMEYTPNSWEVDFGALPTYVYRIDPTTVSYPMEGKVTIRFYKETIPSAGPLTGIHVGGVLLMDDKESVGDGMGIGGIGMVYDSELYLPSSSDTTMRNGGMMKVLTLDRRFEIVENRTFLERVDKIGTVIVEYTVMDKIVEVSVRYNWVPVDSRLIIFNEVDSRSFTRFVDHAGQDIDGPKGWSELQAWYNYLLDEQGNGFRIDLPPEGYEYASLFLGTPDELSRRDVVGMDFVIDVKEGTENLFQYNVYMVG